MRCWSARGAAPMSKETKYIPSKKMVALSFATTARLMEELSTVTDRIPKRSCLAFQYLRARWRSTAHQLHLCAHQRSIGSGPKPARQGRSNCDLRRCAHHERSRRQSGVYARYISSLYHPTLIRTGLAFIERSVGTTGRFFYIFTAFLPRNTP